MRDELYPETIRWIKERLHAKGLLDSHCCLFDALYDDHVGCPILRWAQESIKIGSNQINRTCVEYQHLACCWILLLTDTIISV